jgi:hypothetical protein
MYALYQNWNVTSKLHFGNHYPNVGQKITFLNSGHILICGLAPDGSSFFDSTTGFPIHLDGKFVITLSKISGYNEPVGQVHELVKKDIEFFQTFLMSLASEKEILIVLNVDKSMLDHYRGKSLFSSWLVFDRGFMIRYMEGIELKFANDRLARVQFDKAKLRRDKFDEDDERFTSLTNTMCKRANDAFIFQLEYNFQKSSPEPVLKRRRSSTRVIIDSDDDERVDKK